MSSSENSCDASDASDASNASSTRSAPDHSYEREVASALIDHMSESLRELTTILSNKSHLHTFGGTINVVSEPKPTPTSDGQTTSPPVTIRWDTGTESDPDACARINFPVPQNTSAGRGVDRLAMAGHAATLDRGGEAVADSSYLEIDASSFSCTFDPHSLGIVDAIAQVLLPIAVDSPTNRSVRAELSNLNIYRGPAGPFESRDVGPSSESFFGFLVVCLPTRHIGGALTVWSNGVAQPYLWDTYRTKANRSTIYWAAFHKDCKRSISGITRGHRVTLTYNLYAVRGSGRLTGMNIAMDVETMPLYNVIDNGMANASCNGFPSSRVGFHCTHTYAYTHGSECPFPDILRGADAVMWEIFDSLGYEPKVVSIVETVNYGEALANPCGSAQHPWRPSVGDSTFYEHDESVVECNSLGLYVSDEPIEVPQNNDEIYRIFDREMRGEFVPYIVWLNSPVCQEELQMVLCTQADIFSEDDNVNIDQIYSRCVIMVEPPYREWNVSF